jgi:hypothetical protein
MDADMQAREAGNMEHNARVIMAERDEAIQRGNDWCDQARKLRDERDHARKAVELVIGDTAAELGCAPDNEAILKAIAALKAERDRLLKTLTTARAAVPLHWVIFSDERGLLVGILKEPAHD